MLSFKLKDLHIVNFPVIDVKSEGGADYMEALDAGGTGIDGKHIIVGVTHNLEDVGVAADKDVGTIVMDEFPGPDIIAAGIAADMGQKYGEPLPLEIAVHRMGIAQVIVVAVARHSHQGFEFFYFPGKVEASAEVSCVPDFIDRLKEVPELGVEGAVGV